MLKFTGYGSAFNTKLGNTSAYIEDGDSLLIIDCGGTVFHSLMEKGLLENRNTLNIVITHTHPDHVGSLGELIFYAYYVVNIIPNLYFPKKELMKDFLRCIGVEEVMVHMDCNSETEIQMNSCVYGLKFLEVAHLPTLPSYGLLLKNGEHSFYYSGDANEIPLPVIEQLEEGKLDRIYQDTCGLDYEGNGHLNFGKLCRLIQPEYRSKVICMHHDKALDIDQVLEEGFLLPSL